MALEVHPMLFKSVRSILHCAGARRYFARGTRFIRTPSHDTDEKTNGEAPDRNRANVKTGIEFIAPVGNETAAQLLDNAASYRDRTTGKGPFNRIEDVWDSAPYPKNSNWSRSQAKYSVRAAGDPKKTSVLLFPGQGAQFVGMGKDLLQYPNVKELYALASSILGFDLLQLCLNGPKVMLDQTLYCQPAIVVTSLAALEKLKETHPDAARSCVATAGFSVGEISALTFAGSITFENAIKLVKIRAEAMHLAAQSTPSGMMTVFFGPDSNVNSACALAKDHCKKLGLELFDCRIANYLYPSCKVVAGNKEALDFIQKNASLFKLKRLKKLPVSGAFHTDLMNPAVEVMKKALRKIPVLEPTIRVHSNVDGKGYRDSKHIVKQLPMQIQKPVRWEQTMHIIYERNSDQAFPTTYEIGPGNSLKAILKMVNAKAAASLVSVDV